MDNMYPPPGGDSREWPTQQFEPLAGQHGHPEPGNPQWPGGGAGGGPSGAGGGPGGPDGGSDGPDGGSDGSDGTDGGQRSRRLRRGVAIGAAAVLLCGGAAAGAALAGSGAPAAAGPTGPAGPAAVLNTMLSSASSPAAFGAAAPAGPQAMAGRCQKAAARRRAAGVAGTAGTAGTRQAGRAVRRACGRRLRRVRVLAGIHGQFTFETKTGPRTLAFERGVVESVSSGAISVRAQDGITWTWDLVNDTVVRDNGQQAARSALSDGQHVFVGGPVTSGANDARLIVIRAASSAQGAS